MSARSTSTFGAAPIVAASTLVLLLAAACGDDERVSPVSDGGGDATSSTAVGSTSATTSTSSTSSSSTGGGPVIRTIVERNPFGEQVDNLLADGDFELSFGFPGQQGWTTYAANGAPTSLVAETGGLCKSGIRCARVSAGAILFGRGTSAANEVPMRAEVWAKPTTEASCVGLRGYAIGCDSFATKATFNALPTPDADGWCVLRAEVPAAKVASCLYVENASNQAMIFDAASMVAAPEGEAIAAPAITPPVPADTRARMEVLRDRLRGTLPLGAPPRLAPGATPLPGRPYAEPIDVGP